MSTATRIPEGAIKLDVLYGLLRHLRENGADPAEVRSAIREFLGDPDAHAFLEQLTMDWFKARSQAQQLTEVVEGFREHARQRPQLMRVVSRPFSFGTNGDGRRVVYVASASRPNEWHLACLMDEHGAPSPLEWCFTDAEGQFYLGPAPEPLPLRLCDQSRALAAGQHAGLGVGEVVVEDGPERQTVLFCDKQLAGEIEQKLEQGETVIVRHDRVFVESIYETKGPPVEDWLEFPPLDGPGLDELIFPPWLVKEWRRDVRRLVRGTAAFRVALIGPTGTGKTEGVIRAGREAARQTDRPFALIRISAPHIGSSYYSQTERNIARALRQARKLAGEGAIVTVLLDEADALLGNSEGRYEGSVDRRVRESLQELLSEDLPGIAVYATLNQRSDSWLPAPIERRFRKRKYPRPWRSQMAKVAAVYVRSEALEKLDLTAEQFGRRVADYLYSDRFVVASVWLHSGQKLPVRARDLQNCSPGKLRDLVHSFCEDLLDEEEPEAESLEDFWPMLDREFFSHSLNENNLYELTFLAKPGNDAVRKVE